MWGVGSWGGLNLGAEMEPELHEVQVGGMHIPQALLLTAGSLRTMCTAAHPPGLRNEGMLFIAW